MKLIIAAIAAAFAALSAPSFAASHAASAPMAEKKPIAQQDKMASCNKSAGEKKGDERKAYMSDCLSGKPAAPAAAATAAASPECEKSAADKKLAGAAKTSHIKKCMADASAKK